ncbi:MAG: four helix bundle protein [Bacteroidota bacterium]
MSSFKRFEEIEAWKLGRELNRLIYELTTKGAFGRDFALRDQIRRASISVSSNIAEGYARRSPRDFARFLVIARASSAEVVSQLYLALDLGYITDEEFQTTRRVADRAGAACAGLIHYLTSDAGRVREPEPDWHLELPPDEPRTLNSEPTTP